MSSIIDANSSACKNLISNLHYASSSIKNPPSHYQKRWHLAFATIYCSRAFSSNKTMIIINQSTLTNLHKHKSLHHLTTNKICASLDTKPDIGIKGDPHDIQSRQRAFGANTYPNPPPKTLLHFAYESLKDPTILLLLLCAALSLSFGLKQHGPTEGWYDGGSIFLAVFLVISVSSLSNFRQSRQFDRLSRAGNTARAEVIRNGRRHDVPIFEIVVGDVVFLKIGDQVPADGLFLEGHSLSVDESSMTGESDQVEIDPVRNPFLFSGTKVADGYATMVVTSVGTNTSWGEMMSAVILCSDVDEQTPLQARLNGLTSSIGKVGLFVAFSVLVVLLARYFTGNTDEKYRNGTTKSGDVINSVVRIVSAAVTIVVVAIPEGLPLAVTLTLAYSMKRMMSDGAMVRKLSACETMGSATTICTDKTGTLTTNEMRVTRFWLGEDLVIGCYDRIVEDVVELLRQGVGLNTTGGVYGVDEFSGSPTEKAILSWAVAELKMDMEGVRRSCDVVSVETFNSEKKRSGVLMKKDDACHVHWKGAAEMILAMCSHYYDSEGNVKAIDERLRFERIIQGMAAASLRCIAFAHKQVSDDNIIGGQEEATKKIQEDGLVLLGMVGLKDPCRPGVKKAVEECQYAGVNVKMITGDNVFTAKAIAAECGIIHSNQGPNDGLVVEGAEFRNYTEEERMEKVEKIRVMARSSPLDKLLMVQCLKRKGHVVAVTGDGTNDAPALKEADVGLSMGIQGTEVAKESSDIVILDDNFASVVTVLKWGRCVYNNIQKFIQFQLTVNVAALAINFVAAVSAGDVPLTAVQLLWVNLIMDTLGALALATEKPTDELMEKRPVGRTEPLISNVMWRNLMAQAFYQISVLLTLQFRGGSILGVSKEVKDTVIFNTFVLCQVFNEFNARKLEKKNVFEGILGNRLFMGIIGVTLVLQVIMVEFLKKFAGTERLNWEQWGVCVGIGAMSWPIGWVVKFVPVPRKPFFSYLSLKKKLRGI